MNTFPETLRTESSSDLGALEQLSLGCQEKRDLMKASPLGEQKCHLCLFLSTERGAQDLSKGSTVGL